MQTHDMITDCDHGRAQDLLKAWQEEIKKLTKEIDDD